MPRKSVTFPDDMNDRLEEVSGENGPYESFSEAVREHIRAGERLPEVERERDILRDKLAAANARGEIDDKLVRYVENDVDWHEASLPTRLRWWLFGKE